jgi:hypothetical protein
MENASNIPRVTDPIDKMTLEFLMNRNQYKKYVSKIDPVKHKENEAHIQKIRKYRNRITDLTYELLETPEKMVTLDVNDSFDGYVRTLIRYFEMKDMEKRDMDVMFDIIDEDDEDIDLDHINISEENAKESELKMALIQEVDGENKNKNKELLKSFWGKDRVVKQSSMADFPMRKGK